MKKSKSLLMNRWSMAAIIALVVGITIMRILPLFSVHADRTRRNAATTPIQHVVILMMENHTFDNYFGRFPGVNGIKSPLPKGPNPVRTDFDHTAAAEAAAIDGG